jgi:hypothetical protein
MEKEALLKQLGFSDQFLEHLRNYESRVHETHIADADNATASEQFESTQLEVNTLTTFATDLIIKTD